MHISGSDSLQRIGRVTLIANLLFLLGSILYLVPSIWDVLAETHDVGDDQTNEDYTAYTFILFTAALCYAANGFLETFIATSELKLEKAASCHGKAHVMNGSLFAVAAIFEFLSVVTWIDMFFSISSHVYFLNAIGTLWLGRHEDRTVRSAQVAFAGDCLFLFGALIDLVGGYMDILPETLRVSPLVLVWAWLLSAVAWFFDAILYLVAMVIFRREQNADDSTDEELSLVTDPSQLSEEREFDSSWCTDESHVNKTLELIVN